MGSDKNHTPCGQRVPQDKSPHRNSKASPCRATPPPPLIQLKKHGRHGRALAAWKGITGH